LIHELYLTNLLSFKNEFKDSPITENDKEIIKTFKHELERIFKDTFSAELVLYSLISNSRHLVGM